MKIIDKIKIAAIAVTAILFTATGCKKEEDPLARAVLTNETSLTFAAKGAEQQKLSVYSDGAWNSDAPEWIKITPASADGPCEVTVEVTDNVTDGVTDIPRTGKIIFRGRSIERQGEVSVTQLGDTYKGVQEMTVTQVAALEDKAVAKIPSAQVMAVTTKGFIISDGTTNVYAIGEKGVKVGDMVSMNGAKTTDNGLPAFIADEVVVNSNSAPTYPAAKDITDGLDNYKSDSHELVTVSGSLIGNKLKVAGMKLNVVAMDAPESLGLAAADLHKVELKGYFSGSGSSLVNLIVVSFSDKGSDDSLIPYPIKYIIRQEGIINFKQTFPQEGKIEPVLGLGYIEYVPYDLEHTNDNNKYLLDVSDNSPRCTGPWPGDYWLFFGTGAIKAGSQVHIAFEARTSATGHKFWRLEYLDGDDWKIAGEALNTTEPGEEVIYTHAMASDGSTNIPVDATVTFRKNMENCQFRFMCVANWQANGKGKLTTRNGGSARLSVTSPDDATYQPHIEIVKEGNGVETDPVYAKIAVSETVLAFEGIPDAPKKFTVSSDNDYTISSSVDWLSLDITEGAAGEEKVITVTCAPSQLPNLREGLIKIVSGDSKSEIRVIQSAAGQTLKPLVSIIGGNKTAVLDKAGSSTVRIQSNVEITAESDAAWLTVAPVPASKAMVEELAFALTYEANTLEAERTAHVYFRNVAEGLETVLTVTQSGFSWFADDFSWVQPYADGYADDSVADNNAGGEAPNAYTYDKEKRFIAAFTAKGYEDLNPKPEVMYLQKYYLKFGKTGYHTGIRLPAVEFKGTTPMDVLLKFDWCAHMTGKGSIDDVQLVVELEGGGICEGSEAPVSNKFVTAQTKGHLEWQHASVGLKGVTGATRIKIYPVNMGNKPKVKPTQQRWYIDNIKIVNP